MAEHQDKIYQQNQEIIKKIQNNSKISKYHQLNKNKQ